LNGRALANRCRSSSKVEVTICELDSLTRIVGAREDTFRGRNPAAPGSSANAAGRGRSPVRVVAVPVVRKHGENFQEALQEAFWEFCSATFGLVTCFAGTRTLAVR
jgi:hypothetical protein